MYTNFPLWPKTGSEKFSVMIDHAVTPVALSAGVVDISVGAVDACGAVVVDVVVVVVVVVMVVEVVVVVVGTVVEGVVIGSVVAGDVDVEVDASSTTGVAVWMTEGIVAGGRVFTTRSGLNAGGVDAKVVVGDVIDVDDAVA